MSDNCEGCKKELTSEEADKNYNVYKMILCDTCLESRISEDAVDSGCEGCKEKLDNIELIKKILSNITEKSTLYTKHRAR